MRILRQVAGNATSLRSGPDLSPTTVGDDRAMHVLTHRERQIIRLVSEGLSNKAIGRQLDISDGTIRVHLHKIFQKLEVTNRTALAALAISQDS
jgi:two-component system nitrate/nitrite response regulator NarL